MPLYTPGRRRAIVLLLLTSVLLLTLDLRGNAVFDAARSGFTKMMDPVESAADVATKPVRNAWHGIMDWDQVSQENEQLRDQLDAQRGDQIAAQAAIQDYQELLAANNLPALGDYPVVTAMVVGESPSNFDQVVEINKGKRDGLEVGMAVTTSAGLVGKITTPLLADRAYVMLLTDNRYRTAVKVVQGAPDPTTTTQAPPSSLLEGSAPPASADVTGALPPVPGSSVPSSVPTSAPPTSAPADTTPPGSTTTTTTTIDLSKPRDTGQFVGKGPVSLPQVDLLADTPVFGRIAEGDLVYTAGGSDSLAPPDIPIGTVKNVIGRSSAEGPLLEVQPSVDLDRLHFVSIIIYQSESEAPTVSSQAGG
jgi:cell shape-determining protein MreC